MRASLYPSTGSLLEPIVSFVIGASTDGESAKVNLGKAHALASGIGNMVASALSGIAHQTWAIMSSRILEKFPPAKCLDW